MGTLVIEKTNSCMESLLIWGDSFLLPKLVLMDCLHKTTSGNLLCFVLIGATSLLLFPESLSQTQHIVKLNGKNEA